MLELHVSRGWRIESRLTQAHVCMLQLCRDLSHTHSNGKLAGSNLLGKDIFDLRYVLQMLINTGRYAQLSQKAYLVCVLGDVLAHMLHFW